MKDPKEEQVQELQDIQDGKSNDATIAADNAEQKVIDDAAAVDDVAFMSLITQLRIYDVLMAIYTEQNKEGAALMYERHSEGKLAGPPVVIDMPEW